MTANFQNESIGNMDKLLELQPDRPILISEFWPGWFDHWFGFGSERSTLVRPIVFVCLVGPFDACAMIVVFAFDSGHRARGAVDACSLIAR